MSESFWKKEIHLRKPRVEAARTPKVKSESFWRKERRVRSRPEALPPLPQHLLDSRRAPRGTVVVPVVPGRSNATERFAQEFNEWVARALEPSDEEHPPAETPQDDVTLTELDAVPVVDPAAAIEAEPAWPPPWEFKPMIEPLVELDPEPVFEPFAVETPPALTELGSAVSEPEADLASEPNQVPEFPTRQVKAPLLKREIHFRKPKAAKPPKAKKEGKEKGGPPLELPLDPLELREVADPDPAPTEKVPLLKREVNFRKPKSDKTPKQKAEKPGGEGHKITRVVGLRIGSTQLTAAHVRNNGTSEVQQLARTPLEHGVVVAGEVRDSAALAKALKSFFAANKLPRKGIRLGIASNRIGVRVLDVPAVDDRKQFENAIRFSAQESLPIPVADAVLDHVVLSDEMVDGEAMKRVLLVFAHRELIARYVDVCREAGLRLTGIDLDAFALLRAVGPEPEGEVRRASVAVAIGHERTVFAVSDGEVCDFTRVLEWGSAAIDVAIARALNRSPSEAEPLKLALDLRADEPPAGLSPMQFEAARAAVTAEIGHLVRELLSSLRFYQSRPGSLDLRAVVLSGGGAELRGFAEEVQRGLGVPVHVGDPFLRVSLAKRVKAPENAGAYSVAIGLGIEA